MSFVVVYPPGLRGIQNGDPSGLFAQRAWRLATESVDGSSLPLERVDDVQGGDGLATSVFGVSNRITDDGFEEGLEDSTGLLIDEAGDSLDTTSAG